jgi:cell division cycle 2-like protein
MFVRCHHFSSFRQSTKGEEVQRFIIMVKRDRWDSSSDEEEKQPNAATPITKTKADEPETKVTRQEPRFPLHNPLLQGCRSVYDTYERLARVSEGTYGVVWKARDLATNEVVALKQIKFDADQQKNQGFPVTALREISVLLALNHESIVTVKEMVVGSTNDKVFMVMEFMELDLQEAMKQKRQYPNVLRQAELKGVMQQILSGTSHMHSKWFLHRDLKTSNILVHRSGKVALCDFGLARRYQDPPRALTQLVVTLWYRAPELLFGEDCYGPAIDMWSLGCIFGELICQEAMMQGQGELDQIDKIFSMVGAPTEEAWPDFSKLPSAGIFRWKSTQNTLLPGKFPVNAPPHFRQTFLDGNGYDLLSKLLTLDPKKRITAQEALNHKYFSKGVLPEVSVFF